MIESGWAFFRALVVMVLIIIALWAWFAILAVAVQG